MRWATLALVTAAICVAQTPAEIKFAVAPSKARQPTATSVMPAYTGNQILFTGVTLKALAAYAFGWDEANIAAKEAWTNATRYDVVARAPATYSATQFQQFTREFLETRFRMKSHKETRSGQVYDLVLASPPRHRLKPSNTAQSFSSIVGGRIIAKRWTMSQFASLLQRIPEAGRPVRDKTGLSGVFDIDLPYASGLPAALEQQLGLKLQPTTAPVEFLVIDTVSQP